MNGGNTDWERSVAGVAMVGSRVLLARHTYGSGRGRLIIPGGYVERGETPQEALRREFLEETGVSVEPGEILGVRFNARDWYVVFRAEYVSGEARPDGDASDEVVWMDAGEALGRGDVPDLTKKMIVAAMNQGRGLAPEGYDGPTEPGPYSLYMASDSNRSDAEVYQGG